MPYSSFTIPQIKEQFGIVIQEGQRFLSSDLPTPPVSGWVSLVGDRPGG